MKTYLLTTKDHTVSIDTITGEIAVDTRTLTEADAFELDDAASQDDIDHLMPKVRAMCKPLGFMPYDVPVRFH